MLGDIWNIQQMYFENTANLSVLPEHGRIEVAVDTSLSDQSIQVYSIVCVF